MNGFTGTEEKASFQLDEESSPLFGILGLGTQKLRFSERKLGFLERKLRGKGRNFDEKIHERVKKLEPCLDGVIFHFWRTSKARRKGFGDVGNGLFHGPHWMLCCSPTL